MTHLLALDTIKVKIPNFTKNASILDLGLWRKTVDAEPGKPPQTRFSYSGGVIGLNKISFIQESDIGELECSAKILGNRYFDGINLDTLDQFSESFKLPAVNLKPSFIDDSYILRMDVTKNIKPKNLNKALHDMGILRLNRHFRITDRGSTIEFNANAKKGSRLIFYDKYKELAIARNKNFIRAYPGLIDQALCVLRAERNIRSFAEIREACAIPKSSALGVKFLDVLHSKEKPILSLFNKITQVQLPLFLLNELPKYETWGQYEKIVGRRTIIKECLYDIEVIKGMILSKQKTRNPSRLIRAYKELIAEMKSEMEAHQELTEGLIEIRELLSA